MDGKTLQRDRKYTWEEIRNHNTATDCWIVIDGKVYDVSKWLKYHPGGILPLLYSAGEDCSGVFKAFHPFSWIREKRLPPFYIGDICEPENAEAKESIISAELDKIHKEIVEEGGYETFCKLNISISPYCHMSFISLHILFRVSSQICLVIFLTRDTFKVISKRCEKLL